MELSDKELKTLESLGQAFFSIKKCIIILEIADAVSFMKAIKNPTSAIYKAYYKGLFSQQLKLRESIIEVAMRGSNPAQQQVLKFIESAVNENS